MDSKRREYDIVVIGDEGHLAYNRVGLTSFFQHREVKNMYLNDQNWVGARIKVDSRGLLTMVSMIIIQKAPSPITLIHSLLLSTNKRSSLQLRGETLFPMTFLL